MAGGQSCSGIQRELEQALGVRFSGCASSIQSRGFDINVTVPTEDGAQVYEVRRNGEIFQRYHPAVKYEKYYKGDALRPRWWAAVSPSQVCAAHRLVEQHVEEHSGARGVWHSVKTLFRSGRFSEGPDVGADGFAKFCEPPTARGEGKKLPMVEIGSPQSTANRLETSLNGRVERFFDGAVRHTYNSHASRDRSLAGVELHYSMVFSKDGRPQVAKLEAGIIDEKPFVPAGHPGLDRLSKAIVAQLIRATKREPFPTTNKGVEFSVVFRPSQAQGKAGSAPFEISHVKML